MTWQEIRNQFPETFVLLDKCEEERIDDNKIAITKGEVVFTTKNGKVIYDEFCKHGQPPQMVFGHTHWKKLEIEEIPFLGIRPRSDNA